MKQAGKGPGMAAGEQASGWAMLDAGDVVVHVMTEDARAQWGIEEVRSRAVFVWRCSRLGYFGANRSPVFLVQIWDEKAKELDAVVAKLAREGDRDE